MELWVSRLASRFCCWLCPASLDVFVVKWVIPVVVRGAPGGRGELRGNVCEALDGLCR